ncbi:uncharacterized protein [Littorina saxatilis]
MRTEGHSSLIKSHEAEDRHDIPVEFLSEDNLRNESFQSDEERPRLFMALQQSRMQGQRPVHLKEKADLKRLSIESREASFEKENDGESPGAGADEPPFWEGPRSAREMAIAGWERVNSRKAQCSYCKVTARNWSAYDDVWMKHKIISPCCRRLRQVGDGGIHPSPEGKKRRTLSDSAVQDLFR